MSLTTTGTPSGLEADSWLRHHEDCIRRTRDQQVENTPHMKREGAPKSHVGEWRKLRNQSSDDRASIHDDEVARASGFEAALVPGSTVGTAAMPAVFARYGPRWMEGGWYEFKFVSPVYEHDDVREIAEATAGKEDMGVRIQTSQGRLCCFGRAGLGGALPWTSQRDRARDAEEVLPDIDIGLTYDEAEFTVTPDDVASLLEAAGENSPWYRDSSPWGAPVVPPEWLMDVASQQRPPRTLRYDGVRQPGMWSAHSLSVQRPLALATPYTMTCRIADKGRSRRTVFLTHEFAVRDAEGAQVAVGRLQTKWFAAM